MPKASTGLIRSIPSFIDRLRQGNKQTIVFYGTSLTASGAWVPMLSESLNTAFPGLVTTWNAGSNGQHSNWGREQLEERVLHRQPDAVFIEFAVNDAVARFHISQGQTRANLNEMIDRILEQNPECNIILQVMNPVIDHPEGHDGWRPDLEAYQDIYRQVAKERGLILFDHMPAWSRLLQTDEETFRKWVPDGLHPESEGYRQLVLPEITRGLGI